MKGSLVLLPIAAGALALAACGSVAKQTAHYTTSPPTTSAGGTVTSARSEVHFRCSVFGGQALAGGDAPNWLSSRELAFTGPGGTPDRVFVADLDDGSCVLVAHDAFGIEGVGGVARSGRVVFADANFRLFSVSLRTHKVSKIGPCSEATSPGELVFSVSPDGRTVAYTASCNYRQEPKVVTVPIRGGHVRSLSAASADPSFSPNGREVVFSRGRGGSLVVEPATGGKTSQLDVGGYAPSWSPNGHWIAFLSGQTVRGGELELVALKGHKTRRLVSGVWGGFSWSPSSQQLVFATQTEVGTVDLSGKTHLFKLPHGYRPTGDPPQWSPDGRHIAFALRSRHEDHIYLSTPAGSHLQLVE